ncbi:MAG: metalloregulator ArsR/SmtB family transcription factor [Deltaproteobacteria bacterium]|nr:metalloregulator ArsR/SmtB family transcription factor [Deltaproteobacteria bacterium]
MVKYSSHALDIAFAALSDPTRRALLLRLKRGGASVTELASPFRMSLPAISKHLRILEEAGLLRSEKKGRVRQCLPVAGPMREAAMWIADYSRFWEDQLDALERFLEKSGKAPRGTTRKKEEQPWPPPTRKSRRASRSSGPSAPPARKSSKRSHRPKR